MDEDVKQALLASIEHWMRLAAGLRLLGEKVKQMAEWEAHFK